jgi:hypothetical protein
MPATRVRRRMDFPRAGSSGLVVQHHGLDDLSYLERVVRRVHRVDLIEIASGHTLECVQNVGGCPSNVSQWMDKRMDNVGSLEVIVEAPFLRTPVR